MNITKALLTLALSAAFVEAAASPAGAPRAGNRVAMGSAHACVIREDGTVQCWGNNSFGQLGDNTLTNHAAPAAVQIVNNAVALAAGGNHTCALLADGTVRCWGLNSFGQLGDGSVTNRQIPTAVTGLTGVAAISAGTGFSCAVLVSGEARCWGRNDLGQLGNANNVQSLAPQAVRTNATTPLTGVVTLASGVNHSCALSVSGLVTCWGDNTDGQLGNGTNTASNVAAGVALSGITALAAGRSHSCAVRVDATLHCWGDNSGGQLGDNTLADRNVPVQSLTGALNAKNVSAGQQHTCLLRANGTVECWGANNFAQLGDGASLSRNTPSLPVLNATLVVAISSQFHSTCALLADDSVRCWGLNNGGQIGDGTLLNRNNAVLTLAAGTIGGRAISAGTQDTCAERSSGSGACWGFNANGQVGDGTFTSRTTAVPVSGLAGVVTISTGVSHSCALIADGTVKCWGFGDALGTGGIANSTTPVLVSGLTNALMVSVGDFFTCALRAGGTVQCWGYNDEGQLGNGTVQPDTPTLTPGIVTGVSDATMVSGGARYACVLRANGAAQCWGANNRGQVGNGSASGQPLPVPVSGLLNATAIAAGAFHTCAVVAGGTARCWGFISDGSPSLSGTQELIPVPVPGLTDSVAISTGDLTTCALQVSGTVRCWGRNPRGQIGNGTTLGTVLPTLVKDTGGLTSLTGMVSLEVGTSYACAIGVNGQPFCWGDNSQLKLGRGTNVAFSSLPLQVLSFTFNIVPSVTTNANGKKADLFALANCPAGARVRIEVELRQGNVEGEGLANGDCTGRLERYPVEIRAEDHDRFIAGAAVASAEAEVRLHSQTIDEQKWTRNVVIAVQ